MQNKKAAIELSINFFVILIISLVVFGSGISLFWKIYQSGEEELGKVSRTVEQRIIRQLHGGEKVSVVPRTVELERDDQYIVGIGIKNLLADEKVFKIFSQRGLFVKDELICSFTPDVGEEDCTAEHNIPPLILLGGNSEIRIEPNKQEITNIMIKADKKARSGEYVINICVCFEKCIDYDSCKVNPYDKNYPTSKIRVKIR